MSQSPTEKSSWKLAEPASRDTQGLVVSGFRKLTTGRALFLELDWPEGSRGGAWLARLQAVAPITDAVPPDGASEETRAAAVAFTWTGLQRMGLADSALASFSRPFQEGMFQEDRLRRLGDRRRDKWLETVIDQGPIWSANTPLRQPAISDPAPVLDGLSGQVEQQVRTRLTVHALLLLYTKDEDGADQWSAEVEKVLLQDDVRVVHRLPLVLDVEGGKISREHFGFADGMSQPTPYDEKGQTVTIDGVPVKADPLHGVPLGEILIGYMNAHEERAPGPVVPDKPSGSPASAGLRPHVQAEGFFDFGLNGSYMVVRELKQDVAEFWKSMDANSARIREQDPGHSGEVTADWLAERVVGRSRDGHLLCPLPERYLKADPAGIPDNEFRFHERDPHGVGCPVGSHVRRANPRDSLAPTPAERETLLKAANNHRILRRGRKFGRKLANERVDDGEDRGLLFICLNTDIARQFEFVQQTWLLNSNFATLFDEVDPLLGPKGRMTIREDPLRRTVHVETFVKMAGGDYFFLPSLSALSYLAAL